MFRSWYATCPRGAEPVLARELEELGAKGIRAGQGGVRFTGERETALRACLDLRTALRVLEPVAEFAATNAEELYAGAEKVPWNELVAPGQTIAVSATGRAPGLTHTHFVELKIKDAVVEIWQANAHGRYNHSTDQGSAPLDTSFIGFGRSGTAEDGSYWFETVKPGPVPFDGERQRLQAPHICVTVFARGLLNHLVTRLYFEDEPTNALDPVLQCVPDPRRATLLARRETGGAAIVYRFDIVLQGAGETAFFNV